MPKSKATATPKKQATRFGKTGKWFLQHTYQMRDVDRIPLDAASEDEAFEQGRAIFKKYPDLDETCIVFISDDRSLKYVSPKRL